MFSEIARGVAFLLGICVNVFPSIKNKLKSGKFLAALIIPIIIIAGFIVYNYLRWGIEIKDSTIYGLLWSYSFFFAFVLYVLYTEELTPFINGGIVALYTLLLGYMIWTVNRELGSKVIFLLVLYSLILLANARSARKPSAAFKIFFYGWYALVLLGVLFINLYNLGFLASEDLFSVMAATNPLENFILGMFLMSIIINIFSFAGMLPDRNRKKEVEKHKKLLASKYGEMKINKMQFMILLLSTGCIIFLNNVLKIMNETILIDLLIAIIPTIISHQPGGKKRYVLPRD